MGEKRRKYALYIIAPIMRAAHSALTKCVPITSLESNSPCNHIRRDENDDKWVRKIHEVECQRCDRIERPQKLTPPTKKAHCSSVISGPPTNQHPISYHYFETIICNFKRAAFAVVKIG